MRHYSDEEDIPLDRRIGDWRRRLAGEELRGVQSAARNIARNFWGQAWCRHIGCYQDYASRLPRARSYLRSGAVLDLRIAPGELAARVVGRELYELKISIEPLAPARWTAIARECAGRLDSLADLLAGNLSDEVLRMLCDPERGLFPEPSEIRFNCNCPDWADLCKHAAAALYGFGVRLDEDPALLFTLRGIDQRDLFDAGAAAVTATALPEFDAAALSAAFDIDLEELP